MSRIKMTRQEKDRLLKRRDIVASLWARGLSYREIQATMANPSNPSFMLNPETQQPYDWSTIRRDIHHIRAQSEKSIEDSVEKHKANQLLEVKELRRAAWAKKDLKSVAQAIDLEMKLTGTISSKLDVNLKRKPDSAEGMTDEELEKLIAASLAARRSAGTAEAAPGTNEPA